MSNKFFEVWITNMTEVQKVEPKSYDMLNEYASAVGALSTLREANTAELKAFITNCFGVQLERLSALHSQFFARPVDLENNIEINEGLDRVLQHFSACGLSTKKALSLLFPDAIKLAAFKYSEQAAINAYEMEMHNIQMVIQHETEVEDWVSTHDS